MGDSQTQGPDAAKVEILLVDDTPANLVALEAILTDANYQLISASSGDEALKRANEHEFALMLLDVMMPVMDGFELAKRLKREGRNRHTPIIFLTAVANDYRYINKGYEVGGVDYLTKPLVAEQVQAKVAVFIDLWLHKQEIQRLSRSLERRVEERTWELRQAEERFRLMIEEVKDYAIFTLSPDGKVMTWNKGAERFTGYCTDEIIGRPFGIFFPPEDVDDAERELAEATEKDRADDERWHVKKSGERFWALGVTTAVRDDAGVLCGFTKVMRDFTERQRAEERLKESEARLRLAVEATDLGTWDFNPLTGARRWSHRCKQIFGLPAAAPVDHDALLQALHPDDRARVDATIQATLAGAHDGKYDIEYRTATTDAGRERWVRSAGQAFFDERGRAVRFIGTMLDISEQKRAEEELRHSESNFRLLAETMPQIVWTAKPDGNIDYFNQRWFVYTGLSEAESYDLRWTAALHPDDEMAAAAAWRRSVEAGDVFEGEHRLRRRDGEHHWYLCRAIAVRDEAGQVLRWLGTSTDIDDQKRAQEELRAAREVADAANQAKSAFLANMSHEIRTPLNAIMGFSEFLPDAGLDEAERREFAATIRRNSRLLVQLIDDILDLSKVEAGKLNVERVECSLPELLADVKTLLSLPVREKGLRFAIRFEGRVPERITTDPTRLKQILLNIAGNAVKFTPGGAVDIVVAVQRSDLADGAPPRLAFVVKDSGCGISSEEQRRLFQPFSQAHASTTRKYGGTGLGLALSRRLAQALGGDVLLIDSALGKGSTFTITIDPGATSGAADSAALKSTASPPPPSGPQETPMRLAGVRVLVAEDAPDSQVLISRFLTTMGADVVVAGDGAVAVERALGGKFDVVLMDLQMPELDGFEATAALRRQGYRGPIIAMTAHAMKEERDRAVAAGVDDHLSKPINMKDLAQKVSEHACTVNRTGNVGR